MKGDIKSNYTVVEGLPVLSRSVAIYPAAAVDHGLAPAVTFAVYCMTWNTDFLATLQYSDDNSVWTDEPDDTAGNTVSIEFTEADFGLVHAPNPRGRYSRLNVDVGGTTVFGVLNISGPLRHVAP